MEVTTLPGVHQLKFMSLIECLSTFLIKYIFQSNREKTNSDFGILNRQAVLEKQSSEFKTASKTMSYFVFLIETILKGLEALYEAFKG